MRFRRFPRLLTFLDVRKALSVQVHPTDADADLLPSGETGKTEAWVALEPGTESRVYAGLQPATTADVLTRSIANGTVAAQLASFRPQLGDGIFIQAATVHSLSDFVVLRCRKTAT